MIDFDVELTRNILSTDLNKIESIKSKESKIVSENESNSVTFSDLLLNKISESDDLIKKSDDEIKKFLLDRDKNVHGLMLSMEKAEISFRLMMQIRNKLMDAYREVMRMQI